MAARWVAGGQKPRPDQGGTVPAPAPQRLWARARRSVRGTGPEALRADLGPDGFGSAPRPLSTGRPGPSRVTPADRAALALRALTGGEAHWRAALRAAQLDLAASGGVLVRRDAPWPSADGAGAESP